ncbi:MAG: peptidoglycan DD-metalloendopeptidase family protein [Nocardioidaceae bacterium]
MARVFPHGRLIGLAVTAVLIAVVGLPAGQTYADGGKLKHKQHQLNSQIDAGKADLDEVSTALVKAAASLQAAEAKLSQARSELAAAEGRVAAASALDSALQRRLEQAIQSLADARAQLARGKVTQAEQRDAVAAYAVQQFQGPSPQILGLTVVFNATTAQQLSTDLTAVDTALSRGSASLDQLRATRILLAAQEQRVEQAKDDVAQRRAAAARNLRLQQQAEAEAHDWTARVASLVQDRRVARENAAAAVAQEKQRLADLRKERQRIRHMLANLPHHQATQTSYNGPSDGFLSYPVNGPITSPYGMRMHPILHIWELHDGTDFGVGCHTPIRAAASGTVIEMYYNAGYGNRLIMDNGVVDGINLATSYNHMSGYSAYVGQSVNRGEVIGYVGETGYATGCHLHFMVYENGATVDPMTWL